jgi:YVTN family beta-propeller protein
MPRAALIMAIAIALALSAAAGASSIRIIQTNSAGTNVHLIDPATNKVVGVIHGIEVNHGVASAPDGSRLYITCEADKTLAVVDTKTLQVIKSIPLTAHPNNVAISKDGARVYVAIAAAPGAVDVIDTATLTRAKSIPVQGPLHNTYVTPDGKFVIGGSIAGTRLTVIDQKTEEPVWSLRFDAGVRPIAFEKKPDGSTARLFVQLSDFNGFAIVDFDQRKEVGRVKLPEIPEEERVKEGLQGAPSHGIGVAPDGKTLWVLSKMNSRVYEYAMPDLTLMGEARTGHHPDWLTFTPDSRSVYIANAGSDSVSVVDISTRKVVSEIPVGYVPKRNATAILQ